MTISTELQQLIESYPEAGRISGRYAYPLPDADMYAMLSCPTAQVEFITALGYGLLSPAHMRTEQFEAYSIPLLVEFLKRSHHYYLHDALPGLVQVLSNSIRSYALDNLLPLKILPMLQALYDDLRSHIFWEEEGLFPYALSLHLKGADPKAGKAYSTHFLEDHPSHTHEVHLMIEAVEALSVQPHDLLTSTLLRKLNYLHADLELHGFIEDHVLIPKVQRLEEAYK